MHLKAEVLLHVLQNHDQEGQLDPERLVGISRACDIGGRDVGAGDFQDCGLDVWIRDSLDVPIVHCKSQVFQPVLYCNFVEGMHLRRVVFISFWCEIE